MKTPIGLFVTMLVLAVAPTRVEGRRYLDERKFTIHPAPIGADPLQYRLLPAVADQTPGNAATLYLATFHWAGEINADKTFKELRDVPPDAPLDLGENAVRMVDGRPFVRENLLLAARRTWCVWDTSFREQGINALLPWLNDARTLANFMSLDARLRIRQKQYGEAILPLRAGFALADNLDRDPVAVQALIAIGIQSLMLRDVSLLVQQPGAPNLYWPLANLPALDRERGRVLELEAASLFFTFPELRNPRQLSAERTRAVLENLPRLSGRARDHEPAATLLLMIRTYPVAKKYLLDSGIPAAEVEAMPANSAVLAYWVADYEKHTHQLQKWAGLPIWQICQAYSGLEKTTEVAAETNPLLVVLDWSNRVFLQFGLVERERTMLQTVEAIRAYAATHQGQVPGSLDELSPDTPAPLDPLLDKPFEYEGNGGAATLRAPDLRGQPLRRETIYRITIAR